MKVPFEIILHKIIPLYNSSDMLLKWKCVCKFLNNYVITHSYNSFTRKCFNCHAHRFRVIGDKNRCGIKGCMANDLIHPFNFIKDNNGNDYCSENCLINKKKN